MADFKDDPTPSGVQIDWRELVLSFDPKLDDPPVVYEFANGRKFTESLAFYDKDPNVS